MGMYKVHSSVMFQAWTMEVLTEGEARDREMRRGKDLISVLVRENGKESSTHSVGRGKKSPLRSFQVLRLHD